MGIHYLPSKQTISKVIKTIAIAKNKEVFHMPTDVFIECPYIEVNMDIGFTPNYIQCIAKTDNGEDYLTIYNREADGSGITDSKVYHSYFFPPSASSINAVWLGNTDNVYANDKGFKIPVELIDVPYTIIIM